jgi:ATP-dependent RNA circularization protein (DNA/RNA ligase family)
MSQQRTCETVFDKKIDIKNNTNELCYDDRLYVLKILKQHLDLNKIIEHADGCRINLDSMTPDIINKIHHIINTKLQLSKENII